MAATLRRRRLTLPSFDPRPCDRCPGEMRPALRYEATGQGGIPVLICWDCGTEDPPMRQRQIARRDDCAWCGMPFAATAALHVGCAKTLATFKSARRRAGRAMRGALP